MMVNRGKMLPLQRFSSLLTEKETRMGGVKALIKRLPEAKDTA